MTLLDAPAGVFHLPHGGPTDRFEALARLAPVGIFLADNSGYCTFMSPAWATIHRQPLERALGYGWLDFVHPDDHALLRSPTLVNGPDGPRVVQRFRGLRGDGRIRTVEVRLSPLSAADAPTTGWVGTFEDVTDQVRAAKQQAAIARLGLQAAASTDLAALFTAATALLAGPLAAQRCEILQVAPDRLAWLLRTGVGWPAESFGAPIREGTLLALALQAGRDAAVVACLSEAGPQPLILPADQLQHDDALGLVAPLFGDGGQLFGTLGARAGDERLFGPSDAHFLQSAASMLSAAIQRQQAVERGQRRVMALLEQSPDAILRLSQDGRILYANPVAQRLAADPEQPLAGTTVERLRLAEDGTAVWSAVARQVYRTQQAQTVELALHTPPGQGRRIAEARFWAELDDAGQTESVICSLRDVTARYEAEHDRQQLYQQVLAREDRLQQLVARLIGERTQLRTQARSWALEALTDRERTILRMLATGRTNGEIGRALGLTSGTVKNRISQLLPKLGAADRTQAAVLALQLGLLDDEPFAPVKPRQPTDAPAPLPASPAPAWLPGAYDVGHFG